MAVKQTRKRGILLNNNGYRSSGKQLPCAVRNIDGDLHLPRAGVEISADVADAHSGSAMILNFLLGGEGPKIHVALAITGNRIGDAPIIVGRHKSSTRCPRVFFRRELS